MSLVSDLTSIKDIHDGVKNNKVTRFAYTQQAYEGAGYNPDGVTTYDPDAQQNIPTNDISVMKVNQTVVDKGYRARASSLTRMLLNHFFGRVSFNLNKVNDLFNSMLSSFISYIGQANGLATLDSNGRIPYEQLPESAVEYKGAWNANTNTPHLADGTGDNGDTYTVTVAGTQNLGSGSITFFVNDRVVYNGSVWQRFPAGDVKTVCEIAPNSATGNVDLSQQTDITKILNASIIERILVPFIGALWSKITGSTASYTINDVASNGVIWVACTEGHGILWSADEGATWNQTMTTAIQNYSFDSVIYGNGMFVAISIDSGAWWSYDGMTWTHCTGTYTFSSTSTTFTIDLSSLTLIKKSLFYHDGSFILGARHFSYTPPSSSPISSDSNCWKSTDGKNFVYQGGIVYNTSLSGGVAPNCIENRFMYSKYYRYGGYPSDLPVTITLPIYVEGLTVNISVTLRTNTPVSAGIIAYAKGILLFGWGGKTYYSTDLSNYSPIHKNGTNDELYLGYKTFIADVFVGADANGTMWVSSDGINFFMTQVSLDGAKLIKAVELNHICLALTDKGIYKSFDGLGWKKSETASIANIQFNGVGYENNKLIAGSTGNGMYESDYTMVAV